MDPRIELLKAQTRRTFLGRTALGLGAAALASLEGRTWAQDAARTDALAPKAPAFAPKAKNVIYLYMAGSPSQLDLFDYKPELQKRDGELCPKEFFEGKRFAFIRGQPNLLGTPFRFAQHGQSGAWITEHLPRFAKVIDKVALIRSMHTDQFNHAPAQLFLLTGTPVFGGATLGSWVTYGLGSEASDLPGFVVLVTGGKKPSAGKSIWGSGFLPTVYQGVQCRTNGDPVLFLSDPPGTDRIGRRQMLDALAALNRRTLERDGDPETETRIQQYELAYRMQVSVPDVMDISKEPQEVLDLYGARPGHRSVSDGADDPRAVTQGNDAAFANSCLLARRLVERGTRFVQIFDWGWDHHGVAPGEDIPNNLPLKCQQIDRAMSGLLIDLERRGLLDETLVVWGGEFGRTPMRQNAGAKFIGRDHHADAYTMWLAGGGIEGGQVIGATDEFGYSITEDPISVRDLQATMLHLLGLDAWKLTYPYQGLNQRLIGPEGEGTILEKLIRA
ncbi:MAG: DUF1501 domain-containing protein [Planctomycetota bacterium]